MPKMLISVILTVIFTYFFTKIMIISFGEEYSGFRKREIVKYQITQKTGAIACITKNTYQEIQDFYQNKNFDAIKKEIKNGNCIILKYLDEVEGLEDICNKGDKNNVKSFKTNKFTLHNLYLPCFAVEMKKIKPQQ